VGRLLESLVLIEEAVRLARLALKKDHIEARVINELMEERRAILSMQPGDRTPPESEEE
jgi:hypothetical protein